MCVCVKSAKGFLRVLATFEGRSEAPRDGAAKMSFASDKLYKGYLRRKMATIVSTVKTSEIIPHLPCLTDHDRENIEAKRETRGNYDSMVLLLDCLKRRENWVEEFISALEECNHPTIAADIRREYNALRGNSTAGSPPAAVTKAHVHPEPSDSRLSIPETGADGEAAVPQPAVPSAPPQPAAQASPPMPPQPPETPAVPGSPPAEPVSQPQQAAQLRVVAVPTTPPPSPELRPAGAAGRSPPPPREDVSHQEPVENSEPEDIQVFSEQLSTGAAPQPHGSVEQSEDDTPPQGEDLQTTTAPAEASSPPSPPPTEVDSNLTYGTTVSVITPNKTPIQDTTPPDLEEEKLPVPACAQDVDCRLQPEVAAAAAPLPGAAVMEDSQIESALSKPGELISVPAQPLDGLTLPEPDSTVEPYSGNTARLEISSEAESPAHVPACSALTSTSANTSSMLPCQENGIAVNHNEPEENHYESPSESLELQEVRESTLQICEEPSILNMDGHDSTQQGPVVNGEAAKGISLAAAAAAVGDELANSSPASEVYQPSAPAPGESSPPALQDSTPSHFLATNTKYFVTAAGVGACALLLAWKFKH